MKILLSEAENRGRPGRTKFLESAGKRTAGQSAPLCGKPVSTHKGRCLTCPAHENILRAPPD